MNKDPACPCHRSGPSVKPKERIRASVLTYLRWAWRYLSSFCLHPVFQRSLTKARHVWDNRESLCMLPLSTFHTFGCCKEGMASWARHGPMQTVGSKILQCTRSCASTVFPAWACSSRRWLLARSPWRRVATRKRSLWKVLLKGSPSYRFQGQPLLSRRLSASWSLRDSLISSTL